MNVRQQKLTIAALEKIDDVCADYEKGWQRGEAQAIESLVDKHDEGLARSVLLAELIVLEVDYRRRRGEKPGIDEFLQRFPEDAEVVQEALGDRQPPRGAFQPPSIEKLSQLFPKLQIECLIGVGGMGAVYKARQPGLDRVVALKVLPEEFSHDVKFAMRFTREARTLAKLNHPNIVSVYEFGSAEDTYYFLMEYVEGSTLREVVQSQTLAPEHALAIVPRLCDALQYAHDKSVIHRDIKPENILMSVDGEVKIADFGLSRILGESQSLALTATHQIMGTPRYMAPEQLEGSRSVDHRADIYSLGVIFYEMLTGELPIGRFAAPSKKVQVDVRLDEVVLRTLEKEPQLRYQTAVAIKSDLQSIASGEHILGTVDRLRNDTLDYSSSSGDQNSTLHLQEQDAAARLLINRRRLMRRVQDSLNPLFFGQVIQILLGVLLIALGARCWSQNTKILLENPLVLYRFICGVTLHVYGVVLIGAAAAVLTRIKRVDYAKPVAEVRKSLDTIKRVYLGVGFLVGFPWWLMWIPIAVAIGFDVVLLPGCLYVSLLVGVIGLAASLWLYIRLQRSASPMAENWRTEFAGNSLANAHKTLDEIDAVGIV